MSSSSSSSSSESIPPASTKRKRRDTLPSGSDASEPDASDASGLDSDVQSTTEEPVLSHADRRRKRKAEKQQKKEGSTTKKRKLDNGNSIPVPAEKSKNSVWVGNMSFKTTRENLKTFFKDVGEVVRIYMPTKPVANPSLKPENRGFAYVDFTTEEAKVAAIALSENPLVGRKLLIKDGNDFNGRPAVAGAEHLMASHATHSKTAQKILRAQKQPPAPTLFLGNLGFETTEQDIRQLFEAHRPKELHRKVDDEEKVKTEEEGKEVRPKDIWLRKIRMGTFEDTGLCKGFAFVDFTSIEHATASLVNPKNHQLNGRKLVVEYAGADAVRRGAPKPKREDRPTPVKRPDGPPRSKQREHREFKHSSRPNKQGPQALNLAPVTSHATKKSSHEEEKIPATGRERRDKGPRARPKPGAALALAKRESAAIVESKGQKIVF